MQLATLRSFVEFAFAFAFASARVLFIHLPSVSSRFRCLHERFSAFFLAPFSKSPLTSPDSEVSVLHMRFYRIRVNKRVKRRQISPFLLSSCKCRLRYDTQFGWRSAVLAFYKSKIIENPVTAVG